MCHIMDAHDSQHSDNDYKLYCHIVQSYMYVTGFTITAKDYTYFCRTHYKEVTTPFMFLYIYHYTRQMALKAVVYMPFDV